MKKAIWLITLLCAVFGTSPLSLGSPVAERVYLSGQGPSDAVEWDFFCSKGRRSGEWAKIPVPSCWEQHGFGEYDYGHVPVAEKSDETGLYKTTFMVPEAWKEKHVRLVFEGSMTQTEVTLNGKELGFPNYGGYLPFRYILDKSKIKYGEENTLEVLVKKKPDNDSLDWAERKADYWVFGGIYRPVYLEILPREFVDRVAIDAQMDGTFNMDVFPQVQHPTKFRGELNEYVDELVAQIQTLEGDDVGEPMTAPIHGSAGRIRLNTKIMNVATWSPENPNLYQVKLTLRNQGEDIFEKVERFGFRTFEHRLGDGLYLNDKRIMIKGVNRNVFDPQHGRAIDAEQAWHQAREIKAMNVNLVRSHMPPTTAFMNACDELGLLVITELCNWHAPVIDTPIARNLVYEMIAKYQNHPSVILWANGNENGFNLEVDQLYPLYDLQNRPIIHPWAYFDGLNNKHYPKWNHLQKWLRHDKVYLPTEMLHGLYDGGHGAGLEDYWREMMASPVSAGGVLWCWADAAIARTDKDGWLDTDGNHSVDGIVGPYGEKEASYWSIRDIWSPIQIELDALPQTFDGNLPIENLYYETVLDECSFRWKLIKHAKPFETAESNVLAEGELKGPKVQPGQKGKLRLPIFKDTNDADALELAAFSKDGREIMKWAWPIGATDTVSPKTGIVTQSKDNPFEVTVGEAVWNFSPENGQLLNCTAKSFGNGPVLYAATLNGALNPNHTNTNWTTSISREGDCVVITSVNGESAFSWTISPDGSALLEYDFEAPTDELAYCAVGFDLEETQVANKRWRGQGPHRIWGNRLRGPEFGLWENEFNDRIIGVNWGEPAFKGIFGKVDWMQIDLISSTSLLMDPETSATVGVLRPANADENSKEDKKSRTSPVNARWQYPESGGLYLFHKIPAIGTKFIAASDLGPQGSPEIMKDSISGRVTFRVK